MIFNPYNFKNNADFKQQLNTLLYDNFPLQNKIYGQPSQAIFTKELKPNLDRTKLNHLNGLMNKMLDNIKNIYYPDTSLKMQNIRQLMIYMNNCHACKELKPYFISIGRELNKRLRFYYYQMVEINEVIEVNINGTIIKKTGKQILDDYNIKGVPVILQNFVAKQIMLKSGQKKHVIEKVPLFVSFDYAIPPFKYVAQTWDIDNLYLESNYLNSLEKI